MADFTVTTRVNWIERVNSSRNGNPRFRLHTDDGAYLTQSDSMLGYEVANMFEGSENWIGEDVRLMCTSTGGHVWDIRKV